MRIQDTFVRCREWHTLVLHIEYDIKVRWFYKNENAVRNYISTEFVYRLLHVPWHRRRTATLCENTLQTVIT